MAQQPARDNNETASRVASPLNCALPVTDDRNRKRKASNLGPDECAADNDSVAVGVAASDDRTSLLPALPAPPLPPPLFSLRPRLDYSVRPPDFLQLARLYPSFARFVQSRGAGRRAHIDFRDPAAITALTRVLLLHDFQLHFDLPPQHLCPPIPQRLAVLYWVDDLLSEQQRQLHSSSAALTRRGIDVGCGASVIFPLLGARSFGWQFVATEVDPPAIAAAQHNVDSNGLQTAIRIRAVADGQQLLVGVIGADDGHFDFVVCNPPFFSSPASASAQRSPHRTSAATLSEPVL